MGKKQHQSDKLYLTTVEWKNFFGGKKDDVRKAKFRRLPFHCCALSMTPFEHPYCTKDGVIFDLTNIVPFIKKFGISPITGEKLTSKDLIKLKFHKNAKGQYHCPVTFKVFNENSHIAAVRTTGNVFAHEALEELNFKAKNFRDLLTDEPFKRTDIIIIQDPSNLDKFNFTKFYHIEKGLRVKDGISSGGSGLRNIRSLNAETKDVIETLNKEYKPVKKELQSTDDNEKFPIGGSTTKLNAAHFSTGRAAASLTSTVMDTETKIEPALIKEDSLRYARIRKKAYVRVITNLGFLNVELASDVVPKTCENFLKHCETGYYTDTIFHRSIRNFVIQGGDPTGTGQGGDSIWGGPFKDEFKPNLLHSGRGVLAMANSGPHTNKSQFYFTYRSAPHLNNKHTVFGKVVGGLETLDKMEAIPVDEKDRPESAITITGVQIFVNPFDEADEELAEERKKLAMKQEAEEKERKRRLARLPASSDSTDNMNKLKAFRAGIGKYINPKFNSSSISDNIASEEKDNNDIVKLHNNNQNNSVVSGVRKKKRLSQKLHLPQPSSSGDVISGKSSPNDASSATTVLGTNEELDEVIELKRQKKKRGNYSGVTFGNFSSC